VGQSLTLECSGTIVRGIISDVKLEWMYDTSVVNSTSVPTGAMDNLQVYRISYTITRLKSDDDGKYSCRLIINSSPKITVNEIVTLDIFGKQLARL